MCNGDVTGDSSARYRSGEQRVLGILCDIGRVEFVLDLSEVVKKCEGREYDQTGDNQHW